MANETIDCRGMACPQPVVSAKRKLGEMEKGALDVLVDNETAKSNLIKLASGLGMDSAVRQDGDLFTVTILKGDDVLSEEQNAGGKTLLVTGDTFGRGSEELGGLLMKSFFYALAESDRRPVAVFLVNGGVKLACEGSPVLESLARLAESSVEVQSCGLCLDFFQLKDSLRVGEITNMYAIVDRLMKSATVIL